MRTPYPWVGHQQFLLCGNRSVKLFLVVSLDSQYVPTKADALGN